MQRHLHARHAVLKQGVLFLAAMQRFGNKEYESVGELREITDNLFLLVSISDEINTDDFDDDDDILTLEDGTRVLQTVRHATVSLAVGPDMVMELSATPDPL